MTLKTAMILAAGRGERLRPYTDIRPKPLLCHAGEPVILRHVRNLAAAGFERIIINHAWLGGQIRQTLQDGSAFGVVIQYAPEPPGGLETGGGLFHALPLLGQEPFLALNADIVTDYPLYQAHCPKGALAHLILTESTEHRDFGLDTQGFVRNTSRQYIYTGIAVYTSAFFQAWQPGRYSVTPFLRHACDQETITGEVYQGFWRDIGTMVLDT